MKRVALIISAVIAAATVGVLTALGGSHAQAGQSSLVQAKLSEFSVSFQPKTVPAGKVTFSVRNAGTVEHELVVVRRARGTLPIKNYKALEPQGAVVGEVEGIAPSKSGHVTLTLKAGRYLLICNVPGHYQLGMRGTLFVR